MALDLSALEEKPAAPAVLAAPSPAETGKALRLKWSDIEPDPNQPRTEKKAEEIAEIGESIKERGVKQPISVKAHPSKPGKWMINDGELRWLGTQWAKVEDIPVVVDEDFDEFDQVNANEKRFALRPMELAVFIKRKLDEGVKKAEIARRLGKPATTITELMALVDAPDCIEAVYSSGRCSSPKTLYELRMLAEKFPEQVQEWCDKAEDVTRRSVTELGDILKGKKPAGTENLSHDKGSGGAGEGEGAGNQDGAGAGSGAGEGEGRAAGEGQGNGGGTGEEGKAKSPKNKTEGEGKGGSEGEGEGEGGRDTGELTSWPKGRAISDPDRMNKPLMLVEFDGRSAAVLLNRRPSTAGLIHIRFEDGGGDQEVAACDCMINLLTESEK